MAYIRTIVPEEATGLLKQQYDVAVTRAGRVFNIVRISSLNPRALEGSIRLYQTLMMEPGPLPRATREMIATVTSLALNCFY